MRLAKSGPTVIFFGPLEQLGGRDPFNPLRTRTTEPTLTLCRGASVADTVATTCIDGVIWSSRATEFLLLLLLHIIQCNCVFKPL